MTRIPDSPDPIATPVTTPLPPAGWYPDPNDPNEKRWWDGTRWAETASGIGQTPAANAVRARWRPTLTTWIVAALAVLVGAIGAGSNGLGGFLVGVSLFGIGASIWALVKKRPSWLNLPRTRRAAGSALGISAAVLLLGALIAPHPQASDQAVGVRADASISSAATPGATRESTPTPTPAAKSTPTPKPTPVTTVQVVETSDPLPYGQSSYEDPDADAGTSVVVTAGVAGTKVSRWEITLVDGVETGRTLVSETVTVAPIDEVTAIGTRQPPPAEAAPEESPPDGGGCDPNYAGACVPIASDVDCAGGSGNGPAYVQGPVQVIGSDIYDLDRDGDGIACD
ncbi:G5 domain-containing protein [Herbiconiux sp. UC225_62]|uniref:G5 domain-containing protein n=1 Tax=Herbiconiux sp. UC225_62 TaxID=3350168 RepID=UPI0036D2B308